MKIEFHEILTAPTRRLASGVALLKIDDGVEFLHTEGHAGCRVATASNTIGQMGGDGIIVKARLDRAWTYPVELKGRKVFYRFYRDTDRNGKERPYLYLAAMSEDTEYRGTRCILIATNGVFMLPEKSISDMLYRWIGTTGKRPKYIPPHVMGVEVEVEVEVGVEVEEEEFFDFHDYD